MKLKIYLLTLSLGLLSHKSVAQHSVSGKCIDQAHRPVPYLDVIASRGDRIARGTLTDSAGVFRLALPDGSYTLSVTFLGKKLFEKQIAFTQSLQLGAIQVNTDMQLKGVVVSTRKKLIEQKVDRLVFNVANSLAAAGGDALDALRITPGLRVQNDQISMIGKGSLRVMVDGRILPLSGSDLTDYLQSISADDIERIEVISTPPAQYEAEGDSGLINIVYKKGRKNAWNANLRSAYKQMTYPVDSWGSSFTYKKDKLSLTANAHCANGSRLVMNSSTLLYPEQTESNISHWRNFFEPSLSGRIAVDYRWSDQLLTGFQYTAHNTHVRQTGHRQTNLRNAQTSALNSLLISNLKSSIEFPSHAFDFYVEYKPDSTDKKITLNLDYFIHNNNKDQLYTSDTQLPGGRIMPEGSISGNHQGKREMENYSAKVDVELPLKVVNLALGGKLSFSNTDNDLRVYDLSRGIRELDSKQSNRFTYEENTQAFYLSANRSFKDKWQTQLGLRLENTQTQGSSRQLNQRHTHDYNRLFPTAYVTYSPDSDHHFTLRYGNRIHRPYYRFLNPFRETLNAYSYIVGNPYLQPAYIHNIELSYAPPHWVHTLYFSRVTGDFMQITTKDPKTNTEQIKPQNYLNAHSFGLKESYTYSPWDWWESLNFLTFSYTRNKVTFPNVQENRWQVTTYASTDHNFALNRGKTLLLNVNFWLQFPTRGDRYTTQSTSELNLAVKLLFLRKNLQLSLKANDVFHDAYDTSVSYTNNVRDEYKNYYDRRNFRISLLYKFGNDKIKVKRREAGNEEERKRL